jgi:copper oxidase (laccase) domain-containing protein
LQPKEDKYLLDLKAANRDMLIEYGVKSDNIEVSNLCTFEKEYLHSYRRDGKVSGRALGIIALKKD